MSTFTPKPFISLTQRGRSAGGLAAATPKDGRSAGVRERSVGAFLCLLAYAAAVLDGGVLLGHTTSLLPDDARVLGAVLSVLCAVLAVPGIWLLTGADDPAFCPILRNVLRGQLPLLLIFLAFRAGASLGLGGWFAEKAVFSYLLLAISPLLLALAWYISKIAVVLGDATLRKLARCVIGLLLGCYVLLGTVLVIGVSYGVDWTDPNSTHTTPMPDRVMLIMGGLCVLFLAALGVSLILYEPVLHRLWHTLRKSARGEGPVLN